MAGSSVRAKWAVISMLVVGFSINAITVHADSVGPNSPTTCVNDNSVGDVDWFTPERAVSANNQYAARFTGTQTSYLKCTDFGFNIASGRSIAGIVVENEVATTAAGNNTVDAAQRIVRSGIIGSQNRNNPMAWPLLTDTYLSHGSPTDTWGECWCAKPTGQACDNPACGNVNNPNFGAALSAGPSGGTIAGRVDHVRMTVYFTPPCGLTAPGNTCVPGGGSRRSDCEMELRTSPVPPLKRNIPVNRLTCFEGDRFCDADLNITNNSCTIRTSFCINNNDPRFPDCVPSQLVSFEVKKPNPARLKDAADTANLATLEDEGGAGGFGLSVLRKGTVIFAGSANATTDICGAARDIVVPLRVANSGKVSRGSKSIRIQATNALGKRDADSFRYTCKPSTCGNNIIEIDHEDCDDGNRNNGDGCDQGCRIEVAPVDTPTPTTTPTPTVGGNTPTQTLTRTPTRTPTITPTTTPTDTPPAPVDTATPEPTETATVTPGGGGAIGQHVLNLVPGKPVCRGICVGGPVPGRRCQFDAGSSGCGGGGGTCQTKVCYGGPTPGNACAFDGQCGVTDGCAQSPPQGSCAIVQGDVIPATRVPLLGSLVIDIGAPDGNGVATVTVPAANTQLDAALVSGIGYACVSQGDDGFGIIDCDGGAANLDALLERDHNTAISGICMRGSNAGGACISDAQCPGVSSTGVCNLFNSGPANGLPDDPSCTAALVQPDSSLSVACPEGERVCVGGVNQGIPCLGDPDCPGSTCSTTQCGGGDNVGMPCSTDSNCPGGRCAAFVCRGGSNDGNFCALATDCPSGVCIPCSGNDTATGHTGICSSPTKFTQSGTFGVGDLQVAVPLAIQILAADGTQNGPDALPCSDDDTPNAPPAPVTVVLSTGTTTIKIYDANNINNNKIAPGELCSGAPCVTELTGGPFSCATLATSVTAGGTISGGFPALDTLASDIATTFQFVGQ